MQIWFYNGKSGEVIQTIVQKSTWNQCAEAVLALNGNDRMLALFVQDQFPAKKRGSLDIWGGGGEYDRVHVQWNTWNGREGLLYFLTDPELLSDSRLVEIVHPHTRGFEPIGHTVSKALALKALDEYYYNKGFSGDLQWILNPIYNDKDK